MITTFVSPLHFCLNLRRTCILWKRRRKKSMSQNTRFFMFTTYLHRRDCTKSLWYITSQNWVATYRFTSNNYIMNHQSNKKCQAIETNIQKCKATFKHTSQWTTSLRLTIVQLVQNHFMTSIRFCKGSQSLSSSSSSNKSWLLYISWKVISLCLVFLCDKVTLQIGI